jgi:hypothetical protein
MQDMLCRGDVVAVVLGIGNWRALPVCTVLGILQGSDQPYDVTLTEARTLATKREHMTIDVCGFCGLHTCKPVLQQARGRGVGSQHRSCSNRYYNGSDA